MADTEKQYKVTAQFGAGIVATSRTRAGIVVGREDGYVGPLTDEQLAAIEEDTYLTVSEVTEGSEDSGVASEIIEKAKAEADGVLEAARADAQTITDSAKDAAIQVAADAKAKGDDIVKAAKDLAKDITDKAKAEAKKIVDDAKAKPEAK